MTFPRWSEQLEMAPTSDITANSFLSVESVSLGRDISIVAWFVSCADQSTKRLSIRLRNVLSFRMIREEFANDPIASACIAMGPILIDADSRLKSEILEAGIEVPSLVERSIHYVVVTEQFVFDALSTHPISVEHVDS